MLEKALRKLLEEKSKVIVAIDGPCASGKTTLAAKIAEKFDAALIHMDDFFLRPEQRTPERLSEPGGNLDRERFQREVLVPLAQNEEFSYRPYLCSKGILGEKILVPKKELYIIEGSYSHHPFFGEYALKLFLEVSPETQRKRLEKRSPEKLPRFIEEWIPMEENYFSYFSIREKADLVIKTEEADR